MFLFCHFWNTEHNVKVTSCQLNPLSECICIVWIVILLRRGNPLPVGQRRTWTEWRSSICVQLKCIQVHTEREFLLNAVCLDIFSLAQPFNTKYTKIKRASTMWVNDLCRKQLHLLFDMSGVLKRWSRACTCVVRDLYWCRSHNPLINPKWARKEDLGRF